MDKLYVLMCKNYLEAHPCQDADKHHFRRVNGVAWRCQCGVIIDNDASFLLSQYERMHPEAVDIQLRTGE